MATSVDRVHAYLLMAAGCLGAGVCGALFDQLTATISPEYFLEGKDLASSTLPFRWAVAQTGFLGALPLGALITGAALLDARSCPDFALGAWASRVAATLTATVIVCALLMPALDPFGIRALGQWPSDVSTRLLVCWGMHVGAYLGALLAVLLELLRAPSTAAPPRAPAAGG